MSASLAELLNRRVYHDSLQVHWSRARVRELTNALYAVDPMGLRRGFGLPGDEYEPEAVEILARLLGAYGDAPVYDALWEVEKPRSFEAAGNEDALRKVCVDAFRALFGRDCTCAFDEARALSRISEACLRPLEVDGD